ncbi:MAG: hypothetical protein EOO88_01170 [Pedobacter sp.]|nr:MAG: hypothetical protein EOO88_01170 [Pedobacter sp.]
MSREDALNRVFAMIPMTGTPAPRDIDDIAYSFSDIESWDYSPVYELVDTCIAARDMMLRQAADFTSTMRDGINKEGQQLLLEKLDQLAAQLYPWMQQAAKKRLYDKLRKALPGK